MKHRQNVAALHARFAGRSPEIAESSSATGNGPPPPVVVRARTTGDQRRSTAILYGTAFAARYPAGSSGAGATVSIFHHFCLRSLCMITSARTIAAISSLLALGTLSVATLAVAADKPDVEKCYGVAKAGKNDCAGAAHSCSGQSKNDASPKEFIKLPKGTCERVVGGS